MASYSYAAVSETGRVVRGLLDAEDERAARVRLREMGYYVTAIVEHRVHRGWVEWWAGLQKVKVGDLTIFARELSTMISAGLSIISGLTTLEEQTENPRLKQVIGQVICDIQGGSSLADAMGKHRRVFPDIFVSLIRAGESGGVLDEVVERLAGYFERQQELRERVKSAFTYPLVVTGFAILVVTFLVTFIVPIFSRVTAQMGVALPAPTLLLLWISRAISHYWWLIIGVIIGLVVIFKRLQASRRGKSSIDWLKLRAPVFGKLNRKIAISSFVRTLGTLISSGVPIGQSLEVAGQVASNEVIIGAVNDVRTNVSKGESISQPLRFSGAFPTMVVEMVKVGEESGTLSEMLGKIADFYDRDVEYSVKRLITIIEPLLTVVIGVVIGFIALAMYLPYFAVLGGIGH